MNQQDQDFINQVTNVNIIIDNTPRIYLEWINSEKGRDKREKYERLLINNLIVYRNILGKETYITSNHPTFAILEQLYQQHNK